MRSLTAFLIVGVSLAACGGQVDDPAPASKAGSNNPSNAKPTTGCTGACDRFRECASNYFGPEGCLPSCERDFSEPARANVFATCVQGLSCEDIIRSETMNVGPVGFCWGKAGK